MSEVKLSPPQYTLYRQLAYSIGTDPCVQVLPPRQSGNVWIIDLNVCDYQKAVALIDVLKEDYNLGGIQVEVRVHTPEVPDEENTPLQADPIAETRTLIETALTGNPYFVRVIPLVERPPMAPWGDLLVEFLPEVIQFWNDNLAEPSGFVHYVAQDVFAAVMKDTYPEGVSLTFTSCSS